MATAINTSFLQKKETQTELKALCRNNLDKIRNAEEDEILPWEHFEDVKIPGKIWDNVVSHTRASCNNGDLNPSDEQTTMSRQGEECVSLAISHTSRWERSQEEGHIATTARRTKVELQLKRKTTQTPQLIK